MATISGTVLGGTITATYSTSYPSNTTHYLTLIKVSWSNIPPDMVSTIRVALDTTTIASYDPTSAAASKTLNKTTSTTRTHATQTRTLRIQAYYSGGYKEVKTASISISARPSYTVSYAANGGSSTPSAQTKWYDENLTTRAAISHAATSPGNYTVTLNGNGATNPTALTSKRTVSYAFSKWKATNGTLYTAGSSTDQYKANAATTMTAQWTTSESRAAVTLPSISRSGYSWVRWNTNSTNTGTGYAAGASYTPSGNVTLYAIWNRTVTFNANGGSGAPSAQTALATSAITLSSTKPTFSGYTFNRWNTKTDNTGTGYASGGSYAAQNPSVTLYAIWNRTVTYNSNGGSAAPSAQTSVKTSAITLRDKTTNPTRTGYVFKGWATSASGAATYQPSGTYAADKPNVTLYAVWAPEVKITGATRVDAQGNADILGGYVKVDYTVSNQSSCTVSIAATGQTFTNSVSASGSTILGDGSLTKTNPEKAYTITITATGGTYSSGTNSATYTLAKSAYTRPSISYILTQRAAWDEDENVFVEDDEGEFLKLTLDWSVYTFTAPSQTASILVTAKGDGEATNVISTSPVLPSGTLSGDPSVFYFPSAGGSSGPFETEKNYVVTATVTDKFTESTRSDILSAAFYAMDVLGDAYYYQRTTDTSVNASKTYYVLVGGAYEEVENPQAANLSTYYEKSGPRPGHGVAFGMPAKEEGMHLGYSLTLGKGDDEEMAIRYHGPKSPQKMLRFLPNNNDIYGNGIVIGGGSLSSTTDESDELGGSVVIGSGESAGHLVNAIPISPSNETTYIASDGNIEFYSNCNNIANRMRMAFKSNGMLTLIDHDYEIYRTAIDRDAANPSSDQWFQALHINDKDNEKLFLLTSVRRANGQMESGWCVYNENASGNEISNHIYLRIAKDGTQSYSVANGTAFRNAIGASSGVWPPSLGGTGQTTLQATRNAMGLGNTTGALPIANGGTGQTAYAYTNTISNIATAGSGWTISSAAVSYWGDVVTLYMTIKCSSAISIDASGGIADMLVATLKTPYRPAEFTAGYQNEWHGCRFGIASDGKINLTAANGKGAAWTIAANTEIQLRTTYVRNPNG